MENMEMKFWKGKKVFITGHTGFKGSWLCLWLHMLGAQVTGYALKPATDPSLFELARVDRLVKSIIGDIRDLNKLEREITEFQPEIVMHLAAQPIVRESYRMPVETFSINVLGTVNLLETVRVCKRIKAVINVTTDKVYKNNEDQKSFKEHDPLGGYDPYSTSKACSELVAAAYKQSFSLPVATARAGNVIGGGDWALDRLVPDFIRAIIKEEKIMIRNPRAVRPWQHVLEPLKGYLMLAEKIYSDNEKYSGAWNFGPDCEKEKTVEWLTKRLCLLWGNPSCYEIDKKAHVHEAGYLMLDASKAKKELGWKQKWNVDNALKRVVDWYKGYSQGKDMKEITQLQIKEYMNG